METLLGFLHPGAGALRPGLLSFVQETQINKKTKSNNTEQINRKPLIIEVYLRNDHHGNKMDTGKLSMASVLESLRSKELAESIFDYFRDRTFSFLKYFQCDYFVLRVRFYICRYLSSFVPIHPSFISDHLPITF